MSRTGISLFEQAQTHYLHIAIHPFGTFAAARRGDTVRMLTPTLFDSLCNTKSLGCAGEGRPDPQRKHSAAWSSLWSGVSSNGKENLEWRGLEIYSSLNWRSIFSPMSNFSLFDEGRRPQSWELSGISRWCIGNTQTLQWQPRCQTVNNCEL